MLWLLLLFALSYKLKVLGEAAVRPYYLAGVAFGVGLLTHLAVRAGRSHLMAWRNASDRLIVAILALLCGYILVQSLVHPGSFNDVVYAVVTVVLIFSVSVFSLLAWGWEASVIAVYRALLHYCTINIALLSLSLLQPALVQGILVPPLESGFGTRPSGLPGDPTHLGALLALTLLMMFALRSTSVRPAPVRALLIVILLVITGSRNAILSLVLACLVASLAEPRVASALAKVLAGLMLLLAVAGGFAALQPEAAEFVAAVFRFDDPNAYSRFGIWLDMADLVGQMPLLEQLAGGGYLYIQAIYGSPYNAFLRIFFGHGLFAVLAFSLVTLALFLRAVSDPILMRRRLTVALLVFWLSFSMFLDTAFAEFFHFAEFCFWFAAALVTTRSLVRRGPDRSTSLNMYGLKQT